MNDSVFLNNGDSQPCPQYMVWGSCGSLRAGKMMMWLKYPS